MSFIDKHMQNPTGIKMCISHTAATSRGPPLKSYCPNKSNYKNYNKLINPAGFLPWPLSPCFTPLDDLRKSKGLHSVSAYGHGAVYIGPCLRV